VVDNCVHAIPVDSALDKQWNLDYTVTCLSLAALLLSRQLYLHITGSKKQAALQQALAANDAMTLPIHAVCQRSDNPLETFYAPGS
jgi:6-phosphogluconolactonase/glucosamine-6-phosphate isomerase/deaminase